MPNWYGAVGAQLDYHLGDAKKILDARPEIGKGSVIVDIGAHIGTLSVSAALEGARVFAVEPDWENFGRLLLNIQANDVAHLVTPLFFAVTPRSFETTVLRRGGANNGQSGVNFAERIDPEGQPVATISLFDLLDGLDLPTIDLLKIDIEGGEWEIFAEEDAIGLNVEILEHVMRDVKAIDVELHRLDNPDFYAPNDWRPERIGETRAWFEEMGFVLIDTGDETVIRGARRGA